MSQIDGRQPVIVRLADDSTVTGVQASSFEEAFGYSEFGGRGRARKTKRKAARQNKRMTRIANKTARKTARKVGRQTAKTAKIVAKSNKKDARLQGRLNRKALRKDSRGSAEEEIPEMEQDALSSEDLQPGAFAEQDYSEPEYSGNTETAEDAGGEEYESDYEQSPSEDEEGYDGDEDYIGDDDGEAFFDGDDKESSFNAENDNEATVVKIGPAVMDKARRLYWNELMANKLKNKMSSAEGDPFELQISLDGVQSRIAELESELEGYSNAKGKSGRQAAKAARKEVKAAKKAVRQEARAAKKVAKVEKKVARVDNRMAKRGMAPRPVEVAEELEAETSDNQIEVPAEEGSGFDGDGISGTKSVIKFKHVAIAFAIGLAAFGLYKYSTMKKAGVKA